MEKEIDKQFCPICTIEVTPSERYPNYICESCANNPMSADGRSVGFSNVSLSGGFRGFYLDTKEAYNSHICFIKNVKCRANEARFGGIVIQPMEINLKDKIAGGLIGLLVAEALGVPYEFHAKESIPLFEEIEFEPPQGFDRAHKGVPIGTWSDDGAQSLCVLASVLECGKLDVDDLAEKIVAWYREDYMAVDEVFDVGNQTLRAILNLRKGIPPLEAGPNTEMKNGNGSLMRVLPLALWHQGTDEELVNDAQLQSRITHGHIRAQLCCAIYCLWARRILQNSENPWDDAISKIREIYKDGTIEREEIETQIRPDDIHIPEGGGYVLDSLFSAKWANNNKDFESTVKAAISLGNDTDTTACIAGGIAGLKFGVDSIPKRWRENLRGSEIYQPLLDKLLDRI